MDEEKKEGTENQAEVTPEETPPSGVSEVKPSGEEAKLLLDDDGVPLQNRTIEYKRKLDRLTEEHNRLLAEGITPQEPEDVWTIQQRVIAREEYQKEQQANTQSRAILNRMERANPLVKRFRDEIEAELSGMSSKYRSNDYAIKIVVDRVLGANIESILKESETSGSEQPNRRLIPRSETAEPTPSIGGGKVVLTEEERKFSDDRRLWDKGFTDNEIHELYKSHKERKEKKSK